MESLWLDAPVTRTAWAHLDLSAQLPTRGLASAHHGIGRALHWASEHTGLPVVVVAAIALVVAWRLAKKAAHFALQVTVALALLLLATHFGWIRW